MQRTGRRTILAMIALVPTIAVTPRDSARADHAANLEVEVLDAEGGRAHRIVLDHAALAALPQREFVTHTLWTEGPQRFRGVALAALLAHLGLRVDRLDLVAVNDYTVSLPAEAIGPDYPVIAHSRNGAAMPLRDKGPFWLVWNYDADAAFRTQLTYVRSIWQLARITAYPERP